jgi:septal ring factor EnvC (AmiA/AmiB activator)
MLRRIIGIYIFVLLSTVVCFGQKGNTVTGTKSELQTKREAILKEIASAQALLNDVKANEKVTLTQLNALNKKLALREQLIHNISLELNHIGKDITLTQKEIEALNKRLDKYRMEYARSIRYAYKNKEQQNLMVFVFSANTFNEMTRRMEYLKKYRQYRTVQAERIKQIQSSLSLKVNHLNTKKQQRNTLLVDEEKHKQAIQSDADQTKQVAIELKSQVSDLSSQIAKNKAAAAQLDNAIRAQIQKEIAEARRKAQEEAKRQALELARKQAEDDAKRRAIEAQRQDELARQRAIEEEQKRAAALERQAELARKKAEQEAEAQRLKDIEDARKRREEAAAEEKRIADAKSREEQKRRNEERNREIDRRKEEMRQTELAKQKKHAEELDKQKAAAQQQAEQYKSGATVVTVNRNQSTTAGTGAASAAVTTKPPVTEQTNYRNSLPQEAQNLSASFEANRGSLPWPVSHGVIVAPYGNYPHPLEKSVMMRNEGIDIGTNANAPVKAIFKGVVTKIFTVPGMGVSVMVNHGSYFTVYARLSSASVAQGTQLSTGQVVGTAGKNDEGDNVVHLEIWKVNDNGSFNTVNPVGWISGR